MVRVHQLGSMQDQTNNSTRRLNLVTIDQTLPRKDDIPEQTKKVIVLGDNTVKHIRGYDLWKIVRYM